jgi:hypothetical protein
LVMAETKGPPRASTGLAQRPKRGIGQSGGMECGNGIFKSSPHVLAPANQHPERAMSFAPRCVGRAPGWLGESSDSKSRLGSKEGVDGVMQGPKEAKSGGPAVDGRIMGDATVRSEGLDLGRYSRDGGAQNTSDFSSLGICTGGLSNVEASRERCTPCLDSRVQTSQRGALTVDGMKPRSHETKLVTKHVRQVSACRFGRSALQTFGACPNSRQRYFREQVAGVEFWVLCPSPIPLSAAFDTRA